MSYDYDRRSGSGGSSSSGAGTGASPGGPGKRTLTEQVQMRGAESPAGGEQAAGGHAPDGNAPQVDGADHAPPSVQTGGTPAGPMTAAAARQLLQNAFGSYRQITAGQVRVLAQAEFQAAYDAVYGTTQFSWTRYVVPRFGNLNGFAHGGVNYINSAAANITTVPHEMLHTNVAGDWVSVVGSPFDEGATEYLEQHALRAGGIHTTLTHYPNQRAVVQAFLSAGASQDSLFRAYLQGGASTLVAQWVDQHCQGTWAQVKTATEASQWAVARASLAPRAAGTTPGGASPTPGPAPTPTPAPTGTPPAGGRP
jgi:hypothetical protein